MIAGLSATMSSASSDAIAGVSILMRDVYVLIFGKMPSRGRAVSMSRWGLSLITFTALMFTLMADNVISYINNMISLVMSGMFVASMLGRFWPRATWQGGLAAYLGGALCSLTFMFMPSWKAFWGNASMPSVLAALLLACVVVSLITSKKEVSEVEALQILERKTRDGVCLRGCSLCAFLFKMFYCI